MNWFHRMRRFLGQVRQDVSGSFRAPKPIVIITLAVLLIAIGQAGLLIPIFPGLLFTVPGLVLLSLYSPTMYRFLKQRVSDHPKLESFADRVRNWLIIHIKPRQ
jgi:uncharacterized membrane protein YbaN (DUF454 family)